MVDPDNPDGTGITVESWKWSRSDSMTGTFANIAGATMAAYMVMDDDAEMYLKVTAMYADAQGAEQECVLRDGNGGRHWDDDAGDPAGDV